MRYFVELAYNGSAFHGSQRQPNAISVQQVMEEVFSTVLRQPVALTFAGRTDAGVHAEQMFAHFDGMFSEEPDFHVARFNALLPAAVAVKNIFPVPDDAHARFSALERTYEYRITTHKDPFRQDLVTRVAPGLDFNAMNTAARLLLGKHDFASFCKVHTDVKTTFCTVSRAEWTNEMFTISADRFLRNMVRAVVGTLFEVGRGKMSIEDFRSVIEAHNRCAAGQSAPPNGLYLTHISYPATVLGHSYYTFAAQNAVQGKMRSIAVILAAGTGCRAGAGEPKQFRRLADGRTVLETCVAAFAGRVDQICVVTHPDYAERTRDLLQNNNIQIILGGKERWESSWNAIQALADEGDTNILIHDCARPFVSSRIIGDVCAALHTHEAVTVAVPATDTLYVVKDGCVAAIPPRTDYMRAQTPQAFRLSLIRRAYELALQDPNGVVATDDCGIVKHYLPEQPVYIVEGEEANKKLTYKEDFV